MTRKLKDELARVVEKMRAQYGLTPEEAIAALRFNVVWAEIDAQVGFLREQAEADAIGDSE